MKMEMVSERGVEQELAGAKPVKQAEAPAAKEKQPDIQRKLVFTAEIQLGVADFDAAEKELDRVITAHKGYIAKSDVSGKAGGSRQGTWKARVPASKFVEFREAVKKIGDVLHFTSDVSDVTEEYYDLAVRIKNQEAEIADLRKMFDKGSGKLEDTLTVKRELARATTELEQMKGRQRLLENLADLSTVTISLQEKGTYTPSEPVSFGTQISNTFSGSVDLLVSAGKGLVLIGAALTPWSQVLVPAAVALWWWRRRHRTAARPAQPTP
jgi:hypothetical protein